MDDKARYALFRSMNSKCHHCGTRLEWDAFEVRGLSGGWIVEEDEDAQGQPLIQALCYKCAEFEGRGKTARKLVITEDVKPAKGESKAKDAKKDGKDKDAKASKDSE